MSRVMSRVMSRGGRLMKPTSRLGIGRRRWTPNCRRRWRRAPLIRPTSVPLAEASLAEEVAAALDATDKDVGIGGAGLAAAAIELGLVDELRMFRYPVVVGGGTPFLPPVTEHVALELTETRTFGSRVIYERYGRAGDESD